MSIQTSYTVKISEEIIGKLIMQSELQIKALDKREAGFSLIELTVSTVVFLIFISAVYGLLRIGHIKEDTVAGQVEVIKNARLALNTIGRDAVNAGLKYRLSENSPVKVPDNLTNKRLGLSADSDTNLDNLTAVVSGNNINSSTDSILNGTDLVSFAFHDVNSNIGNSILLAKAEQSGNGVAIYARLTSDDASFKPLKGDLYRISVGTTGALGLVTAAESVRGVSYPNAVQGGVTYYTSLYKLTFGHNDPLDINLPYSHSGNILSPRTCPFTGTQVRRCFNDGGSTATAIKINWVSYHVDDNKTLIRRIYGNNADAAAPSDQIQNQPIAYNIENLQIRYLLENGTISDDPSAAGTTGNIVQLDVSISARADIDTVGVNTEKTIELRSTFSTKNLHYVVIG